MDRVTHIIEGVGLGPDFSNIKPAVLEQARIRGTALHAAIALYHKGTLDLGKLHPEWAIGFQAYLRFIEEAKHEPVYSEIEIEHPTWQYQGHPDRIGRINGDPDLCLFDWKFTADLDKDYVRLQLTGYRLAWNMVHPDEPVHRTFGVHLRKDGTYRLHDLTPQFQDENLFLACVMVYRAKKEKGLI